MKDTQSLIFPKSERLGFATLISALFEKGEHEYSFPLRMTYRLIDAESIPEELRRCPVQIMVNAPKKKLRRAVQRVRARRLMREAWRLQRVEFRDKFIATHPDKILHIGFIYLSNELLPYSKISAKMAKLITHLQDTFLSDESK